MKNNKNIEEKLLRIKSLVDECLIEIGTEPVTKKVSHAVIKPHAAQTLADHILALRTEGFFKQPKTPNEVYEKVNLSYPCEKKRVGVELIRLQDKKELRKISGRVGKLKQVSYVA